MRAAVSNMQDVLDEKRFLQAHGLKSMPSHEETVHRLLELEDAVFALAEASGLNLAEDSRGRWHVHHKKVL